MPSAAHPDPSAPISLLFDAIFNNDPALVKSLIALHPGLLTTHDWYHKHEPLHNAAYWNRPEIAQILLSAGANPSATLHLGRTPLHNRPVTPGSQVVEILLVHGANPNARDRWKTTPLFHAATRHAAELLIAAGADPRAMSRHGGTALSAAAGHGCADVVAYLLTQGANPNAQDNRGSVPLGSAASLGHANVAAALIAGNADPNVEDCFNEPPLFWAIWNGHLSVAILLLKQGARLSSKLKRATPLDIAVSSGRLNMVQYFLDQNLDPNAADDAGETPLHRLAFSSAPHTPIGAPLQSIAEALSSIPSTASLPADSDDRQYAEIAELLIERGANPNLRDNTGDTPLHQAIICRSCILIPILLKLCPNPDPFIAAALGRLDLLANLLTIDPQLLHAPDPSGRTPLHWAALAGDLPALQFLLLHNADINAPDDQGDTPLHTAIEAFRSHIAVHLLESGANPGYQNNNGQTPAHVAAAYAASALFTLLAQKGASLETPDEDGWTPLHEACSCEDLAAATALLNFGVNLNPLSDKQKTPLDIAYKAYDKSLPALLKQHGAITGSNRRRKSKSPSL